MHRILIAVLCLSSLRILSGEEMVRVPTGVFQAMTTNLPPVKVQSFLLDKTPVTNGEFLAFVRENPEWQRGRVPRIFADASYLREWEGIDTLGAGAPSDSPVVSVSWFAARAYATWRGKRLPTLAEWEHAASFRPRAAASADILTWYSRPLARPHPAAGSTPANDIGIQDLHGLVWEWTEDFDAISIVSRAGDDNAPSAFFCGGGAGGVVDPSDYASFLRYAFRGSLAATHTLSSLGFRCARDLKKESP